MLYYKLKLNNRKMKLKPKSTECPSTMCPVLAFSSTVTYPKPGTEKTSSGIQGEVTIKVGLIHEMLSFVQGKQVSCSYCKE